MYIHIYVWSIGFYKVLAVMLLDGRVCIWVKLSPKHPSKTAIPTPVD